MGFITTGNTDIVIYLTHLGAEYLAGKKKSATDLIVKYFTLGDSDTNYFVQKKLNKGYVPDLTGEDNTCLKLVNTNIKNSETTISFHRSVIYSDRDDSAVVITTYGNIEKSKTVQKNDCVTGTGSTVTYVVATNTYTSRISQLDADNKAQADVDANTQGWANSHGECLFTHYYYTRTKDFYKNDCDPLSSGSTVPYSKIYDSIISLEDAEAMSVADDANFNIEGQLLANANGVCTQITFWNVELSGTFTKNDCGLGSTGTTTTYTVPAHTYSGSTLAIANALAQTDINTNGQGYANTHGLCIPIAVPFKWIIDESASYCEEGTPSVIIKIINLTSLKLGATTSGGLHFEAPEGQTLTFSMPVDQTYILFNQVSISNPIYTNGKVTGISFPTDVIYGFTPTEFNEIKTLDMTAALTYATSKFKHIATVETINDLVVEQPDTFYINVDFDSEPAQTVVLSSRETGIVPVYSFTPVDLPVNAINYHKVFSVYSPLHAFGWASTTGTNLKTVEFRGIVYNIVDQIALGNFTKSTGIVNGITMDTYTTNLQYFADSSYVIRFKSVPTYTINLDFTVVQDSTTTAKATVFPTNGVGSYTYLWSNGQTTETATGLIKDVEYFCTVTDSNGVSTTGSVIPNIAILYGLQIELMYFDQQTTVTTDKFYPRLVTGGHSCNSARFNVLANGIVLGDANLNNLGGSTEPDIDTYNFPPAPYANPSSYDRYWSKVLTGADASSIAGPDGKVTITVTYVGTGTPHSSAAWVRIKKDDGTVLVSNVVSSFTGYVFDPYSE